MARFPVGEPGRGNPRNAVGKSRGTKYRGTTAADFEHLGQSQIVRQFILRRLPWAAAVLGVYWITLFIGTHVPHLPHVRTSHFDKVMHFSGYAGLAILAAIALLRGNRWSRSGAAAVLVGLMTYAVLDELSQIPIPGRTADLLDWLCDCLGAMTGMILFRLAHKWRLSYLEARRGQGKIAFDRAV